MCVMETKYRAGCAPVAICPQNHALRIPDWICDVQYYGGNCMACELCDFGMCVDCTGYAIQNPAKPFAICDNLHFVKASTNERWEMQ